MLPGLELLVAQCAPLVAPITMLAIVRVESVGVEASGLMNYSEYQLPR